MENIDFVYTSGMDEQEVEECLTNGAVGVLALADGNDAYAIPVGYHFDPDEKRLLIRLEEVEGSDKHSFLDATATARFLVYEFVSPHESWSIMASGHLRRRSHEHEAFDATTINELFPPLRVFGESIDDIDLSIVELSIETLTGRKTVA